MNKKISFNEDVVDRIIEMAWEDRTSFDAIKKQFGIEAKMIESSGGVFEVTLNSSLIFSKKDLGRFPTKNEIEDLLEGYQKVT